MVPSMSAKPKEIQLNAVLLNADEGGYVSMNPETGTFSQGETVDEAVANLREATELYLEECPDECPQGETAGVGIIKPMMVSVNDAVSAEGSIVCKPDQEEENADTRDGKGTCIVPDQENIKSGTLVGMLRQAGISRNEFWSAYKETDAEEEEDADGGKE